MQYWCKVERERERLGGGKGGRHTSDELANPADNVEYALENVGDEGEETHEEVGDAGDEGVDDGVGCADERCDEFVDGGEEIGYGVGDGHFGGGGGVDYIREDEVLSGLVCC